MAKNDKIKQTIEKSERIVKLKQMLHLEYMEKFDKIPATMTESEIKEMQDYTNAEVEKYYEALKFHLRKD